MSERQTKAGNTLSLTHSLTHLLANSLTCTLAYWLALSLSHLPTHTLTHSFSLNMLNNFCFHVYAQKSLFIGKNGNAFFDHIIHTRTCDF